MNGWEFLEKHGPGFVRDFLRCAVIFGVLALNAGNLTDLTEARDTGLIFLLLRAVGVTSGERVS